MESILFIAFLVGCAAVLIVDYRNDPRDGAPKSDEQRQRELDEIQW